MQVHAVYMDDMMSGYTIRDNAFINCTNAVKMSGQDIKIVANKCDGCYAVVHVNPVGVKLPHECAAELRTLDALIATPPWNESFPSLQRIADERACAPVNAFVHDNTCTRTGAGGFLMPEINATWKWSMGNNTCKSDDAVAMATGSTQLFLDDKLLETQRGTRVVMHPLQVDDEQHRPVLVPGGPGGGPWEGGTISAYNSVVQDGPRVMIYYNVISANGPVKDDIKAATCVAISSDFGRTFSKPSLGLVSFNGSTDNNIVMPPNATAWSPGTVFLDDNPDAPADEKYKMIAKWFPDANRSEPNKVIRDGSWTFASPDGLRWRPLSSKPVYLASDTQDVALFDPTLKKCKCSRSLCVFFRSSKQRRHRRRLSAAAPRSIANLPRLRRQRTPAGACARPVAGGGLRLPADGDGKQRLRAPVSPAGVPRGRRLRRQAPAWARRRGECDGSGMLRQGSALYQRLLWCLRDTAMQRDRPRRLPSEGARPVLHRSPGQRRGWLLRPGHERSPLRRTLRELIAAGD